MSQHGGSSEQNQSKTMGSWCLWIFRMVCILCLLAGAISQLYPVADQSLRRVLAVYREAKAPEPLKLDERPDEHRERHASMLLECNGDRAGGPFAADVRKFDAEQARRSANAFRFADGPTAELVEGVQKRLVEIEIKDKQITVSRTVWLGRCSHAMVALRDVLSSGGWSEVLAEERVRSGAMRPAIQNTPVLGIFGSVSMSPGMEERYLPAVVEDGHQSDLLVKVSERSSIAIEAHDDEPLKSYVLYISFGRWPSESNELTVRSGEGVSIWSGMNMPTQQSAALASWKLEGQNDDWLSIRVDSVGQEVKKAEEGGKQAERAVLLRAVNGDVRAVWASWLAIVYAIPFFVVLWWAQRRSVGTSDEAALIQATTEGCRLALSLIGVLAACDVAAAVTSDADDVLRQHGFFNLSWTATLLKAAMVGIVWPLLAGSAPWVVTARRSALAVWLTVGALAFVIFASSPDFGLKKDLTRLLQLLERGDLWSDGFPRGALLILAMVFCLFFAPLASLWGTGKIWMGRPLVGGLLIGLAWLGLDWFSHGPPGGPQLFAGAALAAPFGWAFARTSRRWVPAGSSWATNALVAWWTVLVVVVAVVLALPPDHQRNWSFPWLLSESAWELCRGWKWAAMALLLAWLYPREGADSASVGHREAGAALLFVGFFWQPIPVLSLLASAGAGALVIAFVLYAPRMLRRPSRSRSQMLGQAVREIGIYNRLLRLRRGLQKGIQSKLDKAEIEPVDAMAKLEKMDQEVDARERAAIRKRCIALLALNGGPGGSAWNRGRQGALLASLVALPWVAWYLRAINMSDGATSASAFHVFSLGLADVARWPLLGFLFMYFYPQLRGNSGIQKGMWMTGVVVLPALVGTMVGAPDSMEGWSSVTLWSLQAFVACMLLGVVLGDFGALRLAGRRARGLIEIYNLGTLAAWTSSLALAVGVATTSSIADQAASFVKDRIAQAVAAPGTKPEATKGEGVAK